MITYFRAVVASLKNRNFRVFFIGLTLSQTGTWVQKVAQAWLVLELTGSPVWLGITLGVQQLPVLLMAAWAGLLADRYSKRTLLLWAAVAGALPALALGILTLFDAANIYIVLGLALFIGVVDAIEKPSRQTFPSELVAPAQLTNAVTLTMVMNDIGRSIGPAIAGVLISTVDIPWTFFANALSFAAVAGALLLIDRSTLRPVRRALPAKGQLREGFRYVRSTPLLLLPLLLLGTAGLLAYNFQVLVPLLGWQIFAGDAQTVGYLLAAFGVGSVVGGLAVAGLTNPTIPRVIWAAVALAATLVIAGAAPTLIVALIASGLIGACSVAFKSLTSAWLQLTAEPHMRGRVVSLLVLATAGTTPIGAPLVGWISSEFGTRTAFYVTGLSTALAAAIIYYLLRPVIRAQRESSNEHVPVDEKEKSPGAVVPELDLD